MTVSILYSVVCWDSSRYVCIVKWQQNNCHIARTSCFDLAIKPISCCRLIIIKRIVIQMLISLLDVDNLEIFQQKQLLAN